MYVYIYGRNAAGTYFLKLIFDKSKVIAKITSGYYALSIHGFFGKNFIGF